ncbi:MAG: hypothetical protein CMP59_00450 [Flavobacteriales bacterium]|mgnify:CR=1 FL=1|nr:hypothetical protein [Flavobacteriales bacterium]
MGDWSDQLDNQIVDKYQLDIVNIPAGRQDLAFWLKASLVNRVLSYILPSLLSIRLLAFASSKRCWQLFQTLKDEEFKFDHIEAHTLGALFPSYFFAKQNFKTFSFDVEDFHPGEVIHIQPEWEKKRRYRIMRTILPSAKFITAASPLIARETESLLNGKEVLTVNNSFFQSEFAKPKKSERKEPLRLIWFSQNITDGRGLDLILDNFDRFKDQISLTLVGNMNPSYFEERIAGKAVEIISPLPQIELHRMLADYDIGLLLEKSNVDLNKDICLANKLFAYIQSGLYVLATDTLGHKEFFDQYPQLGSLTAQNSENLGLLLKKLIDRKDHIREMKESRFEFSKSFDYHKEMSNLMPAML